MSFHAAFGINLPVRGMHVLYIIVFSEMLQTVTIKQCELWKQFKMEDPYYITLYYIVKMLS